MLNAAYSTTPQHDHRTAHVHQIVMDVLDDAVEAATGSYSDAMLHAFESLDRVRNYELLTSEVSERLTTVKASKAATLIDYSPNI